MREVAPLAGWHRQGMMRMGSIRKAMRLTVALAAVAAVLVLSSGHMLRHDGQHGQSVVETLPAGSISGSTKGADSGHHLHAHAGAAPDAGEEREVTPAPPCPLCTLPVILLAERPVVLAVRAIHTAHAQWLSSDTNAPPSSVTHLPHQPRAPPAPA
jgi:hypothetical protein